MRLLVLLVSLAFPCLVHAGYLDQSNVNNVLYGYDVFGGSPLNGTIQEIAQTFTMGSNGTLSRITVAISNGLGALSPLTLDLRTTIGGVPVNDDSLVLASVSIASTLIPPIYPQSAADYLVFDLSRFNIRVFSGEVLAFNLGSKTPFPLNYGATYSKGDQYQGGASFTRYPGENSGFLLNTQSDLGFQVFVNAVPTPSSLILLCLGMGGCVARGFRRA